MRMRKSAHYHKYHDSQSPMSSVRIEICTDRSPQNIGPRTTQSHEEAKYEECWPRRRHGAAKRESCISSEGYDHYNPATVHLAERTENQRSEYVADQEHGYGKGKFLLVCDVKIICGVEDSSAWKRRGNGHIEDNEEACADGEQFLGLCNRSQIRKLNE